MRRPAISLSAGVTVLFLGLAACGGSGAGNGASEPREMSGKELYQHWCADCHDPGAGHPATLRMAGDMGEENSVLLKKKVDREVVHFAVRNGFQMMPPFRKTEISDEELERLAEYLAKGEQ